MFNHHIRFTRFNRVTKRKGRVIMAVFTVDSEVIASASARVAASSSTIRTEVASLMAELLSLNTSWVGGASAQFADVITQWQSIQAQVEQTLDSIGHQLQTASSLYADAEAQSMALFGR